MLTVVCGLLFYPGLARTEGGFGRTDGFAVLSVLSGGSHLPRDRCEGDRFLDLTRGLTTILVSHRFSTVQMADVIVVIEGGRVREVGSHEQLRAANGLYAELFELQAHAYR